MLTPVLAVHASFCAPGRVGSSGAKDNNVIVAYLLKAQLWLCTPHTLHSINSV